MKPIVFTVYKSKGLWFWRAERGTGEIVADGSEGIRNKQNLIKTLNNFIASINGYDFHVEVLDGKPK